MKGEDFFLIEKNILPKRDFHGHSIIYKEWDIYPKIIGKNRGSERIVTGSDGSVWYTQDIIKLLFL